MLSSVLTSDRAIRVNIAIMRALVKLRQMLETNRKLARKFSELQRRAGKHDQEIAAILEGDPAPGGPAGKAAARNRISCAREEGALSSG